jgi:hypothetical protein
MAVTLRPENLRMVYRGTGAKLKNLAEKWRFLFIFVGLKTRVSGGNLH